MSTISTAERREVAKELRELAATGCIRYAEEFYEELREIVAYDLDGSFDGVANSLADLIDRSTCKDVTDFDRESFKCSRCGYRVLSIDGAQDAAKLVAPEGGVIDFGYCPNCGAVVVDAN